MALPGLERGTSKIEVLGTMVEVRGMARAEVTHPILLALSQQVDAGDVSAVPEIEVLTLAFGLATEGQRVDARAELVDGRIVGCEWTDAVRAWWAEAPAAAVDEITAEVARLSGLTKESQRQSDPGTAS